MTQSPFPEIETSEDNIRVERQPGGELEIVVFKPHRYDVEEITATINLRSVAEWIKANAPELLK